MTTPVQYSVAAGSRRLIEGVKSKTLRVIPDDRGWLMEILRADDPDLLRSSGRSTCRNVPRRRQGLALPPAADRQLRVCQREVSSYD